MVFPKLPRLRYALLLSLGVILPLVTLSIEVFSHFCGEVFFDPIPTFAHVALVAAVPAANLLVIEALRRQRTGHRWKLGAASGLAAGVSFFYSMLFLPLLPMAVIAIILYGMGLLALAPLFAFIASLSIYSQLVYFESEHGRVRGGGFWPGVAVALLLIFGLNIGDTVTRVGMSMATSEHPDTRQRGIRWLRLLGNEETLLRACYMRSWRTIDVVSWVFTVGDKVTPDEARRIYYRVTGRPFNAVPPPRLTDLTRDMEFEFDPDAGGQTVAGRLKHLSMSGSRLDGSIDPDAALGYVEWTMVFKNSSRGQLEARAQVVLPHDGVVSRLTLWIDGEEREAAFGGRSQVRQAYQRVVQRQRDPVLVTTSGPDRVLIQCFPVPPGGEMKVRMGITFPLVLESRELALVRLPWFLERNFSVPDELQHHVWLEASGPLTAHGEGWKQERPEAKTHTLRGTLSEEALTAAGGTVRVRRASPVVEAWTDDLGCERCQRIRQTITEVPPAAPRRVVLVVDGSSRMEEAIGQVADALDAFPAGVGLEVFLASEEAALRGAIPPGREGALEAARQLREIDAIGGQDNLPALARGWEAAAEQPDSVLVWVHGPQPELLSDPEGLRQRWERRPEGPLLYVIAGTAGPNRVAEALDGLEAVRAIPRLDGLEADLERLFQGWSRTGFVMARTKQAAETPVGTAIRTSPHLARLWARDEVYRQWRRHDPEVLEGAMALAGRYQLVTPVSGAVVLETQAQYDEAGLSPVKPGTVPTVPEPGEWALIAVVTVLLGVMARRRRAWTK